LGAVGGAVLTSIPVQILDTITGWRALRDYLPHALDLAWSDLLASQIDWGDTDPGDLLGAGPTCAVFSALAGWRFARKDITSLSRRFRAVVPRAGSPIWPSRAVRCRPA